MKSIIVLATVALLLANVALAQSPAKQKEPVEVYVTGDRGEFVYPWTSNEYPEFVILQEGPSGSKSGIVSGMITPKTRVKIMNRNIGRENLDLLTGKQVVVIGKFRQVGIGEGSRTYCEELTIAVIPEKH